MSNLTQRTDEITRGRASRLATPAAKLMVMPVVLIVMVALVLGMVLAASPNSSAARETGTPAQAAVSTTPEALEAGAEHAPGSELDALETSTPSPTQTATPAYSLAWCIVPSPGTGNLADVAAISANDVWAVGLDGLTMHWDGSSWTVVPAPTTGALYGVAAVSANDVWAVGGDYYGAVTLHWDGSSWSVVPSSTTGWLYGVAAISANDVWAVGSGYGCGGDRCTLTMHWDGFSWSVVESPNYHYGDFYGDELYDVAAISASDVWAVGSGYADDSYVDAFTMHWDGSSWSLVDIPDPGGNSPYEVAAVSSDDVWAVGLDGLTMHWGGFGWTVVPVPDQYVHLYGVAAASTDDIWAVGYNNHEHQTSTMHWDGSSWTVVPSGTGTGASVYGVAAVSANNVWAVGGRFGEPTVLTIHYSHNCPVSAATPSPTRTNTPTSTPTSTRTNTPTPLPPDAYAFAHFNVPNPFYVSVGTRFTLDLMIESGSNDITAAQSYLTFSNTLLQNVQALSAGCVTIATLTSDLSTFDTVLQNEVCNGPGACASSGPGTVAFASGGLSNCRPGAPCSGDFRVAQVGLCATATGTGLLHWQFSPPDPANRNSKIIDASNFAVHGPGLYADQVVEVLPAGPVPFRGHITMEGRPAQPHLSQSVPVTLTLRVPGGEGSSSFGSIAGSDGVFSVTASAAGTYDYWVKHSQTLANTGTVNALGNLTPEELGVLRAGDANDDNCVDVGDFNVFKGTFGCAPGSCDDRADFDSSGTVDVVDFNLLKSNFGTCGAAPLMPLVPINAGITRSENVSLVINR